MDCQEKRCTNTGTFNGSLQSSRVAAGLAVTFLFALGVFASTARAEKPNDGRTFGPNFSVIGEDAWRPHVYREAERLRKEIAKEWLGETIPNGYGPTLIHVKITDEDQSFTWLLEEGSHRSSHRIWLYTTGEKIDASLAHEICHTVLWAYDDELPVFAQEAVASSFDGHERQAVLRQTLSWFVRKQRWPRLDQLLKDETIKPSDHAQYAAAGSLREFLMTRSPGSAVTRQDRTGRDSQDKQRFLRFASEGGRTGNWDAALRKHYNISSVADLQQSWQQWVEERTTVERTAAVPGNR